jgi:hypothetical protein
MPLVGVKNRIRAKKEPAEEDASAGSTVIGFKIG